MQPQLTHLIAIERSAELQRVSNPGPIGAPASKAQRKPGPSKHAETVTARFARLKSRAATTDC